MPELPEVETTRRALQPYVENQTIQQIIIREHRFRWPIPKNLPKILVKQTIHSIERRGKYLLLNADSGTLLWHLGMSGRIRVLKQQTPINKHDHVDILFAQHCLRFTDPRRFGALLWTDEDPHQHPLLKSLGVEPLTKSFNSKYLLQQTRERKQNIKQFIMDHHIVVGVGNIYANEALFLSAIHPQRSAASLTQNECTKLVSAIRNVLKIAIRKGGTTLKDFCDAAGNPGYFQQELKVYGKRNEQCPTCKQLIQHIILGQRSTFFCAKCQN